jgi:hypothetical protein
MFKIFDLIKTLWEVILMADNRRKWKLSPKWQIYIEIKALDISLKDITIDDVFNHKLLRELVLEECRIVYNCDGYGNPLPKEDKKEVTNSQE